MSSFIFATMFLLILGNANSVGAKLNGVIYILRLSKSSELKNFIGTTSSPVTSSKAVHHGVQSGSNTCNKSCEPYVSYSCLNWPQRPSVKTIATVVHVLDHENNTLSIHTVSPTQAYNTTAPAPSTTVPLGKFGVPGLVPIRTLSPSFVNAVPLTTDAAGDIYALVTLTTNPGSNGTTVTSM